MKKKLLVLVMALASVAAVTGCEKKEDKKGEEGSSASQNSEVKTLACSLTEDDESLKYTFTFEGSSITKLVYTSTKKYKSDSEAKKANESDVKEVKELENVKGVMATAQVSGKSTYNTLTFNVKELDETSKTFYKSILGELETKSYDEIKSTLETGTFTCK